MNEYKYIGTELELFSHVDNWKAYFAQFILPYIRNDVLEVGAGLGSITNIFSKEKWNTWTCLEPDQDMANFLINYTKELQNHTLGTYIVENNTLSSNNFNNKYDCIIYVDVLEHIDEDIIEIETACDHLNNNGNLIILSPAHQSLYSAFDKEIGHYRRYNKEGLSKLMPSFMHCSKLLYLDSIGSSISFANRMLLRNQMPTAKQLYFWDKVIIPISKHVDRLTQYRIGKSILGIWEKNVEQ